MNHSKKVWFGLLKFRTQYAKIFIFASCTGRATTIDGVVSGSCLTTCTHFPLKFSTHALTQHLRTGSWDSYSSKVLDTSLPAQRRQSALFLIQLNIDAPDAFFLLQNKWWFQCILNLAWCSNITLSLNDPTPIPLIVVWHQIEPQNSVNLV